MTEWGYFCLDGKTPSLSLALAWHAIAFLVYFGMLLAKPHEFLERLAS